MTTIRALIKRRPVITYSAAKIDISWTGMGRRCFGVCHNQRTTHSTAERRG